VLVLHNVDFGTNTAISSYVSMPCVILKGILLSNMGKQYHQSKSLLDVRLWMFENVFFTDRIYFRQIGEVKYKLLCLPIRVLPASQGMVNIQNVMEFCSRPIQFNHTLSSFHLLRRSKPLLQPIINSRKESLSKNPIDHGTSHLRICKVDHLNAR